MSDELPTTAELIRAIECPNPHIEAGAELWRIGKRYRIICQSCGGCYSPSPWDITNETQAAWMAKRGQT